MNINKKGQAMRTPDFTICDVRAVPGKSLRYLHMDVLETPCYIEDIEQGQRALIMHKPDYDDRFHRLHTSRVESIARAENDKMVEITTQNTVYVLARSNWDDKTYRGLPCLTREIAEEEIRKYCEDGTGKRLLETIYKDHELDIDSAVTSYLSAVKDWGETRDHAMYHVFWDGLCTQEEST